jgi:hypothetical protein
MRIAILLLTIASVALSCKSAPPRPTGAGSTQVLRVLRDWRGVWSGSIKESPMGPMSYALHIIREGEELVVTMARQKDEGLDGMSQRLELVNFFKGSPRIHYRLSQRNTSQEGELVYIEAASSDAEAVFCAESCDKVRLIVSALGAQELALRAMVNEAPHAEMEVHFSSPSIPKDADEPESAKRPKADGKLRGGEGSEDGPVDQDIILKENVDRDIGEGKATPPPDSSGRPAKNR